MHPSSNSESLPHHGYTGVGLTGVPLQLALPLLSKSRPALGLRLTRDPGMISISNAVVEDGLGAWLELTQECYKGTDNKSVAAYALSILAWRIGDILAGVYLIGARMPALSPADVSVAIFGRLGEPRDDIDLLVHVSADSSGQSFDRAAFTQTTLALFENIVSALHLRTGLSIQAFWRIVTDGIAGGFVAHARIDGNLARAKLEAAAILSSPKLHNRQWQIAEVWADGRREWFRLRGGCCRYYRMPGGRKCSACVLHSRPIQIEKLQALVRQGET